MIKPEGHRFTEVVTLPQSNSPHRGVVMEKIEGGRHITNGCHCELLIKEERWDKN